jgi:hypothetical protein
MSSKSGRQGSSRRPGDPVWRHTTCIEIRSKNGCVIIIDGTGIADGKICWPRVSRVRLSTHAHWDHVGPSDRPHAGRRAASGCPFADEFVRPCLR